MLSYLITSKTRRDILTFFITHPDQRFYHFDLSKRLSLPSSAVHTELKKLAEIGFLKSEREANIRFYWLNKDFVLYPELKSLVFKTVGLAEEIKNDLQKIGAIEVAFIYGSVAKNLEDARSDIDLMIIGDPNEDALAEAISKAESSLSREINYTVFDPDDWRKRVKKKEAFVTDVLKNKKIFLIGGEDELRRIA